MKLFNITDYEKPTPFRDSTLFIIICEGSVREIEYFEFFDRLSRRIKVHAYSPEENKSAPNHVLKAADFYLSKYNDDPLNDNFDSDKDEFWLVMDTDRHADLIHDVIKACNENGVMKYAISNPCFEVWLRFHLKQDSLPPNQNTCEKYKQDLNNSVNGGFHNARHPSLINNANINAEKNILMNGYLPLTGSTTLFELGKKIYSKVKGELKQFNP
tara:strand:- start:81 stop:722 length:642 start_codon:yes stop_codon:yes gene_type:complete